MCETGEPAQPGSSFAKVGYPPIRDWIRVTSNSREMLLAEAFFFLIKGPDSDMNAPDHSTERLQQEQQVSLEKH